MKPFAKAFAHMFDRGSLDLEGAESRQIHRDWDRLRESALSPSERAEIDAIFSRHL